MPLIIKTTDEQKRVINQLLINGYALMRITAMLDNLRWKLRKTGMGDRCITLLLAKKFSLDISFVEECLERLDTFD